MVRRSLGNAMWPGPSWRVIHSPRIRACYSAGTGSALASIDRVELPTAPSYLVGARGRRGPRYEEGRYAAGLSVRLGRSSRGAQVNPFGERRACGFAAPWGVRSSASVVCRAARTAASVPRNTSRLPPYVIWASHCRPAVPITGASVTSRATLTTSPRAAAVAGASTPPRSSGSLSRSVAGSPRSRRPYRHAARERRERSRSHSASVIRRYWAT
jgi:hypothetical protein